MQEILSNIKINSSFSYYLVPVLLLLLPLFFLPFTFDILELNKSLLLVLFFIVSFALLVIQSFQIKKFKITLSYLTLPILIFVVSLLLSLIFSVSTSFSLWGFYGVLSGSFPIFTVIALLALVIPSIINSKKSLLLSLYFLVIGIGISSLFSILNYFDALSFVNGTSLAFLNNDNFSLFGPLGTLRFILPLGSFLASYYVIRTKKPLNQAVSSLSLGASVVAASLYLAPAYMIATFSAGLLPLFLFKTLVSKKNIVYSSSALLVGLALFFASLSPDLSQSILLGKTKPNLNSIDSRTSWTVANNVIGSRPLFGTGLGTFITNYSQNKPAYVNNTNFWDTRFIKPSSFYLLLLTEAGLVGLLAFGYILVRLTMNAFPFSLFNKGSSYHSDLTALKLVTLSFIVIFMFTSGNVLLVSLFFILAGLTIAYEKILQTGKAEDKSIGLALNSTREESEIASLTSSNNTTNSYKIAGACFALVAVGLLYFSYVVFASDLYFKSFFNTPQTLIDLRNNYVKAASLHGRNDFYQRSIIEVDKRIASALLQVDPEQEISEQERQARLQDITGVLRDASLRAQYITEGTDLGINPINWEARGLFWQSVIGLANGADLNARSAYLSANQLDPNNPRIVATLGTVYYQQEDFGNAARFFESAVVLKQDYAAARYNLAKALEQLERYVDAYTVAQTVMQFLPEESQDYTTAQEYADSLRERAEEQIAQAQQQIDLQGEEEATDQPGLTEPDEPLEPSPEQTDTPTTETQSAAPDVVQEEESTEEEGNENNPEATPTPTGDGGSAPSPSPTSNALPGQEPNNEEGEGFVENNQSE